MSKRALVVEDDANIAELLRLYLGKDGFEVMIAPDGGKAESSFVAEPSSIPHAHFPYTVSRGCGCWT